MFEQSWRATPQSISVLRVPDGRSKASERAVGKVSSGSRYVQQIIYLTVFDETLSKVKFFLETSCKKHHPKQLRHKENKRLSRGTGRSVVYWQRLQQLQQQEIIDASNKLIDANCIRTESNFLKPTFQGSPRQKYWGHRVTQHDDSTPMSIRRNLLRALDHVVHIFVHCFEALFKNLIYFFLNIYKNFTSTFFTSKVEADRRHGRAALRR